MWERYKNSARANKSQEFASITSFENVRTSSLCAQSISVVSAGRAWAVNRRDITSYIPCRFKRVVLVFQFTIEKREGLFFFIIIYSSKSVKNNTKKNTPSRIRLDRVSLMEFCKNSVSIIWGLGVDSNKSVVI